MRHFSKNNTLFWRERTEKKRRRKWKERWERVRSKIRVGGRRYSKITHPIWRLLNLYNTRTLTEIDNFSNQYVILTVFYLIKAFKLLSHFLANITRKSSFIEYKKWPAVVSVRINNVLTTLWYSELFLNLRFYYRSDLWRMTFSSKTRNFLCEFHTLCLYEHWLSSLTKRGFLH